MAYSNFLPKTRSFDGSDCTGSDGTADRTYTLPELGILSDGFDITINGTQLLPGAALDYTISGSLITFLNIVDDTDEIRVNYFVTLSVASESSLTTSTSLKYATPTMLAEILGIKGEVPTWAVGSSPALEVVGLGDNSTAVFYLDQKNIISDTYTLSSGATEAAASDLTETTDYVLDGDSGKITLTSAGITAVGTDSIYAEYCYITNGMSNSYLISVLSRAEKEVDRSTNTTFTDGTATNPVYPLLDEIQPSDSFFQNLFYSNRKPLIDVDGTLDGALDDSAVTVDLTDASGFPSSGYILVGSEAILYTGVTSNQLTGCVRGSLSTTAAAHDDLAVVHSTIFLRSATTEGSSVVWTIQPWDTSSYFTNTGFGYKFNSADPDPNSGSDVANRVRLIYLWGNNTVPGDITRLTLIYAKRMLIQDNIGKSMVAGRDEFQPEMFNADLDEMRRIVGSHIVLPMGNT